MVFQNVFIKIDFVKVLVEQVKLLFDHVISKKNKVIIILAVKDFVS